MKHPLLKVSTFGACQETRQFSTTVDQENAEGSMGDVFVGSYTHSGGEIVVVCALLLCLCFSKLFNSRMHGSYFHLLDHCEQSRLVMFKTVSNV